MTHYAQALRKTQARYYARPVVLQQVQQNKRWSSAVRLQESPGGPRSAGPGDERAPTLIIIILTCRF